MKEQLNEEHKPSIDIDKMIIECLAAGMIQSEIAAHFALQNITPSSISAIEKQLKRIKEHHKANTLFHLAVILKRKGMLK